MEINWANPLVWVAVYVGGLLIYTLGSAAFAYYHLLLKPLRYIGKVALVSVPITVVLFGVQSVWRWVTTFEWQSVLDWMGWVTANFVIVSGIGLAWVVVALSARVSWEEWFATKKDALLTRKDRANDEPLLDIGPIDVAADYWQNLVAVVQEWKVGHTENTISAEDDTLELPVIPDVMVNEEAMR